MGHPEIHGPSCLPKHEAKLVSSQKAAHVDVGWVRAAGDPGFARDDKGEGGASIDSRYLGWTERLK
jgi:hypothetical protein